MSKCSIIRNPETNKIERVLAPNGKDSILYQSIMNSLPSSIELDEYVNQALQEGLIKDNSKREIALALWSKVYTPSFKQWFGDSKVVDENGEPMLLFHGGYLNPKNKENAVFKKPESDGFLGKGIYFADIVSATEYLNVFQGNYIIPSFLSIKNPLYLNNKNFGSKKDKIVNKEQLEILKSNKDGIIYISDKLRNLSEQDKLFNEDFGIPETFNDEYVAFEPNQVKSIFNEGEFSIKSDNIYYDLSAEERNDIDPDLEAKINKFLKLLGVDIKYVDRVTDANGKPIDAVAKANLTKMTVELTQSRSIKTLPEEAAHFIVGLLGPENAVVKQMMNSIQEFPEYQEVKERYSEVYSKQDSNPTSVEQRLKMEAIGKVIADRIINENRKPSTSLKGWFTRLIRILSRLFSRVDTSIPGEMVDNFDRLAQALINDKSQIQLANIIHSSEQSRNAKLREVARRYNMNNSGFISSNIIVENLKTDLRKKGLSDITVAKSSKGTYYFKDNGRKVNPFNDEYYDLGEGITQDEIVESFIKSNDELLRINEDNKYELKNNEVLEQRVSDAQKKLFAKNKTKEELEALENSPASIIAREVGTELHKLAEDSLNYIASLDSFKNISLGIESNKVDSLPSTPKSITPNQHNNFNDSIRDLVKSIEDKQSAIDKNKTAKIFTENFVMDKDVSRGGSMDLTVVYSDGSVDIYDFKFINFKQQKINGEWKVPDNEIHFMKEKSYDMQISEYKRILKEKYGVKKFRNTRILPFDVQYQRNNAGFTGKLKSLKGFTNDVNYLMPIPVAAELTENERINEILKSLFTQKKILQEKVKSTYGTALFERSKNELEKLRTSIKNLQVKGDLRPLFESINTTLSNEANLLKDITKDSIKDLNKMQAEINLFQSLYNNIASLVKKDELKNELADISSRLAKAQVAIKQKRIDILTEINPELIEVQRELGALSYFDYTDDINHPAFETFNELLQTVHGNKNKALKELEEKINPLHKNLENWAKSQGKSVFDAFNMLIKNGKLISPYSAEFYEARAKAIQDKDIKWLKSKYKLKENFKAEYEKRLAEEKKVLLLNYSEESNLYKIKLKNWISQNDMINEDSAWANIFSILDYTDVKKPEYSEDFKKIQANKPLLEYYNFYSETMRDFNQLVDERINANFIPNIKNNFLELASQNDGELSTRKQFMKDFQESFMLYQDDEFISGTDNDFKIPLLYYNQIRKLENGKWVADNGRKSKDLTKSMLLFGQAVYKKNELTKIEGIVEALKYHLMEQPVYKTNMVGNIKKDEVTKLPETTTDSKKNLEVFNKHIKALVYGKKIQNKDTIIAKKYSLNKVISNAMSYLSLNSLAANYISAFGNVAAGTGNIFIKAAGGTYFNKKHVKKTLKLVASKGENAKYYKMAEYFNVESQHWAYEKAANLSASKLVKNLTLEKAFVLWQKPDNFMSNTILVSMSQNYGINKETGEVQRLAVLPEGTKSIYEMFDENKDKLESGLTDKQFESFRNKVMYVARRLKGSNTTETMSEAQMTIYGKSFMFFKNWLPPMAAERFQAVSYNKVMGDPQYGRYRSLFKDVLTNGWKKQLPKFLLNLVSFNAIKYKPGELDTAYNEFIKANPDLENKISKAQYVEMRQRTIKEGLLEMRIIATLSMLLLAAKADWDDDGQPFYKSNALTRQMYKLTRRTYLEVSFFADVRSVTELVRNPVPIISIGSDMLKLISNTSDEFFDEIFGLQGVETDKTEKLHYTKRFIPTKHIEKFLEDFQE